METEPYYRKWTLRRNYDQVWGLIDLIEDFPKDPVVVEIGTFAGDSAELFSLVAKKVYTIDPLAWGGIMQVADNYTCDDVKRYLNDRLAKRTNIEYIKKYSKDAVVMFEDNSIDVVYIDGDHEYESVKQDITLWLPKVKVGGLICGHDHNEHPQHAGVIKAVDELLGGYDKHYYDSSWMKVKK